MFHIVTFHKSKWKCLVFITITAAVIALSVALITIQIVFMNKQSGAFFDFFPKYEIIKTADLRIREDN